MTASQEKRLENIERMLKVLLAERTKEWISEGEAMAMLQRGKCWLKIQRNGYKEIPVTLIKGKDWKYINGRTPEYRLKSIEELKRILNLKEVKQNDPSHIHQP